MKFVLIKNHFEIDIKEDIIKIISILPDKNFDNLQNDIKKYIVNAEVYSFLTTVYNLIDTGEAKIENGNVIIENLKLINFDEEDKVNLTFKNKINLIIKLKDRGLIGKSNFCIEHQVLDENNNEIQILGCFAIQNNKFYVLDKYLYELFETIKHINLDKNINNLEFNNWQDIYKIKKVSEFTNIVFSSFLANEKIIIPAAMNIDYRQDEKKNLEIITSLCGLTEQEQELFINKFNTLLDVDDFYTIKSNNTKTRIILTPEIKENLKIIKNLPKKIRRNKDKNIIIQNPLSILKYPDVVNLNNYSERVIAFGLYDKVVSEYKTSNINWGYPISLDLFNLNGEDIIIKINNKDEAKEFKSLLKNAVKTKEVIFSYNDTDIPLSVSNLESLKNFYLQTDKDTSTEGTDNKIILQNSDNELVEFSPKDICIDSIKEQLKENKTLLTINNQNIPVNSFNIPKLIKAFEIHLIIGEGNKNIITVSEDLYKSYCDKFNIELPSNLKKEFLTDNKEIKKLELKKHQLEGIAWLENSYRLKDFGRTGVLLADDMGLGKTIQILTFIFWLKTTILNNQTNNKPILIVAPVILLENWEKEYYKFFDNTLKDPLILHGKTLKRYLKDPNKEFQGKEYYQITDNDSNPKSYLDVEELEKNDIIITNYDTLVNYEFSLCKIDWALVVLDEAQEIKEEKSYKSRITKSLKADFKIAATGTPVENCLIDLWNIFNFLQPDLLGSKKAFVKNFNEKNMSEADYINLQNKFYYSKPYAYILRRTKELTLKNCIPQKHINILKVLLNDEQIVQYRKLKQEFSYKKAIEVLQDMNKYSQHPRLLNPEKIYKKEILIKESPKLQKLIKLLYQIKDKNEKVVIFCFLHEMQTYLKRTLEDEFNISNIDIINGTANGSISRQSRIDKFQLGQNKFNIIILSPLAAGVGLNITGANHVIHYGRWWNPAKENQATDRVYRIGQEKEVFVHYFIEEIEDSSEEKTFDQNLHELLSNKIEVSTNFLKPNEQDISELLLNKYKNNNIDDISKINFVDITNLKNLSPSDFEAYAACYYDKLGYKTVLCQNCCIGMDLIAFNKQEIKIIQCKHTQNNWLQDNTAINNILTAKNIFFENKKVNRKLTLTCFTNSDFDNSTHNEASMEGIELITKQNLLNIQINKIDINYKYLDKFKTQNELENFIEKEFCFNY